MAERIYTIVGEGDLEPLEEAPFSTEDELQALIARHPELLDGEQMRPGDPADGFSLLVRRASPNAPTRVLGGRSTI